MKKMVVFVIIVSFILVGCVGNSSEEVFIAVKEVEDTEIMQDEIENPSESDDSLKNFEDEYYQLAQKEADNISNLFVKFEILYCKETSLYRYYYDCTEDQLRTELSNHSVIIVNKETKEVISTTTNQIAWSGLEDTED